MFSFRDDFLIVPVDETANNVPFIGKHFHDVTTIKDLNRDCHLSNQDDNNTYAFMNNKTNDQIIEEHKLYLSKREIDLTNKMQGLTVMYWISKMYKSPF